MLSQVQCCFQSCAAIAFAACWFFSPIDLVAQIATPALVVATDVADAECVKRIGGEHVHVEVLHADRSSGSYSACNEQAQYLATFRLLIRREEACCPVAEFWHARMVAANPLGKVHRIGCSRRHAPTGYEQRIIHAGEIHRALAAILPEHQDSLETSWRAELQRLRSFQFSVLNTASREGQTQSALIP